MSQKEVPQTGPLAILHALNSLNIEEIEKEAYEQLKTGKKTKRSNAVKTLNIIKGLRRNNMTPDEFMINYVPVIPPKFRPFASQGDNLIAGDANILYKDLFDQIDAYKQEKEVFGEENSGQGRLDLYDSLKALYGYGDPQKAKTKSKEVKGFLKQLTGKTSKQSIFQSKMIAKTMDSVGRSTVIVNPDLGIDDIEMPYDIAFTMYAPYIQRRLKQLGMSDIDAVKAVRDKNDMAKRALQEEVKVRPVIYSRAPAWHSLSINAGKVKLIDGDAIGTNPFVAKGMGMDYDGDTINVHVPSTDAAVKEAYEKFMPSTTAFSNRQEGKIVPLPKQEQIWGAYIAATAPQSQQTVSFNTKEEALQAVKKGTVNLDQDIYYPGMENEPGIQPIKQASEQPVQDEQTDTTENKRKLPARNPITGRFIHTESSINEGKIITNEK